MKPFIGTSFASRGLLAVILATTATSATAQTSNPATQPGSMLVGGTASLTRQEADDFSSTTISIQPEVLFFVKSRLAIGGSLGLSRGSAGDATTTAWSLGPAAKYFFSTSSSTTLPFLGASVHVNGATTDLGTGEAKVNGWGFEPVAGITWLLASHVGLTGEAFFNRRFISTEFTGSTSDNASSTYGVRFGITAFVF